MTSKMCEKFGITYEKYNLNTSAIESFPVIEQNEEKTSCLVGENTETRVVHREELSIDSLGEYNWYCTRIYYITDIHLMHHLQSAQCKSKQDILYKLIKVAEEIVNKSGQTILIGGDICSDFHIFQVFIKILSNKAAGNKRIIFVLGNHELWGFAGKNVDEIVEIYRKVIKDNGMCLIHNEILYEDPDCNFHTISYEDLMSISEEVLRDRLIKSGFVILGGTGFSGYNEEFNANQGIYRNTLDRKGEIAESKNSEYDVFKYYEDGIYKITADQYMDFYRGKNIRMDFGREINILYMLKNNGYYCFIHESTHGVLSILNGGALRHFEGTSVEYYYDNMNEVVSTIESPLNKYLCIQREISEEIKRIGGDGKIHGCIIDIDWYNHIYVNPIDMKAVGYWAENMVNKLVYPDIPALLKAECPNYYKNYQKLFKEDEINLLLPVKKKKNEVTLLPQKYLDTDIYRASREIRKMQKLTSNILTVWYEGKNNGKLLPGGE